MLVRVVAHQDLMILGHYSCHPKLREQVAEDIALNFMQGVIPRQLTGACVVDPYHTMLLVVFVHESAIDGIDLI